MGRRPNLARLILIRYYSSSRAEAPSLRVITLRAEEHLLYESLLFEPKAKSSALRVITLRAEEHLLYESLLFE